MHNCQHSQDELNEIALHGWIPAPDELNNCPRCREELASMRDAMQITESALQLVKPREDFWPGYHVRLRQHLETNSGSPIKSSPYARAATATWLRRLFTTSVPVPVPLAIAVFAAVVFAFGFIIQARTSSPTVPPSTAPSIVTKTVEVPVVQERVVTRVVYRDRRNASPQLAQQLRNRQREETPQVAEGLAGFTPAHEAKLTIIKTSYQDEK